MVYNGDWNESKACDCRSFIRDSCRKPRSYAGTPSLVRLMKQWDNEDYLNGILPVARLYNRALLATEILNNYNSIKGRFV